MAAERGEAPDAGATDAQTAAVQRVLVVADAQRAGGAEQLLEARAAHEVALLLRGEHAAGDLEEEPLSHGGAAERMSYSSSIGTTSPVPEPGCAPPICASIDVTCASPWMRAFQCSNGFTSSNSMGPAPRMRGLPSAPSGVVHLAGAEHVEDAPVRRTRG